MVLTNQDNAWFQPIRTAQVLDIVVMMTMMVSQIFFLFFFFKLCFVPIGIRGSVLRIGFTYFYFMYNIWKVRTRDAGTAASCTNVLISYTHPIFTRINFISRSEGTF